MKATAHKFQKKLIKILRSVRRTLSTWQPRRVDKLFFTIGLKWQETIIKTPRKKTSKRKVEIKVNKKIPQLAWICEKSGEDYSYTIGGTVEQFANGFFEGVWTGDFADYANIVNCDNYGTGALFQNNRCVFLPRKDRTEFIYVFRNKKTHIDYISNSFCYILSVADIREEHETFKSLKDLLTDTTEKQIPKGFYFYNPLVFENNHYQVLRIWNNNFYFAKSGAIRFCQTYRGQVFRSFTEYRNYLKEEMSKVFENAICKSRRTPLPPISTLSTGYDSTAVTSLACTLGCSEAMTIDGTIYGENDSGTCIGQQLNINLKVFEHVFGSKLDDLKMTIADKIGDRAYEFIATPGIGDDASYLSFEGAITHRTLLTGNNGDYIWNKNERCRSGHATVGSFTRSMIEYRLRLGFATFSPAYLGASFPASILKIARSEEMTAYSVGGSYDRPIPRRIAEEAGVKRATFGYRKVATAPDPQDRQQFWTEAVNRIKDRYNSEQL